MGFYIVDRNKKTPVKKEPEIKQGEIDFNNEEGNLVCAYCEKQYTNSKKRFDDDFNLLKKGIDIYMLCPNCEKLTSISQKLKLKFIKDFPEKLKRLSYTKPMTQRIFANRSLKKFKDKKQED